MEDIELKEMQKQQQNCLEDYFERDINFTINSFLNPKSRQATLPPLLDKKVVDHLSETFGIYYFKNTAKEIIYEGKANNIKQRVISHFMIKRKKNKRCV